MRTRHDPRRLDIASAAAQGLRLEGAWPVADLRRLAEDHPDDAPPLGGDVPWSAQAEQRTVGATPQTWLTLDARVDVWRTCQRCLQPLKLPLAVHRELRFVDGEDTAAALDADSEDDVLALTPALDLRELVEDELLLALPLVPRHADCAMALPADPDVTVDGDTSRPNPFAALAALKTKPGGR